MFPFVISGRGRGIGRAIPGIGATQLAYGAYPAPYYVQHVDLSAAYGAYGASPYAASPYATAITYPGLEYPTGLAMREVRYPGK